MVSRPCQRFYRIHPIIFPRPWGIGSIHRDFFCCQTFPPVVIPTIHLIFARCMRLGPLFRIFRTGEAVAVIDLRVWARGATAWTWKQRVGREREGGGWHLVLEGAQNKQSNSVWRTYDKVDGHWN